MWFLRHWARQTNFFLILDHFLTFYTHTPPPSPPKNPENQNFEKMKKIPGDIILHKCTKNHDHMLYCSWNMMRDGCNCYFSFWAIFCPSTPITARKMKTSKKWERPLDFPNSIKGEFHSNYIFLHFALIGLEWDSITLFTKMNFFFFQNSHFNTICTRYIWPFIC